MRLLDADVLAYALYDESPAHQEAWNYMSEHISEGHKLHVSMTTILETYNTLYWYYKVRSREKLLKKIILTMETLEHVETSINGLRIAMEENIPLGDGFLLATAKQHMIPIIASNDQHIIVKTQKYGLISENPITAETREKLANYMPK